jgi:hypothetical protein
MNPASVPRPAGSRALRLLTVGFVIAFVALAPINVLSGHAKPWHALLFGAIGSTYLVAGLLIVERRPGNRIGPIVFGIGALVGGFVVADGYVGLPGPPVGHQVAAWVVSIMDGPLFALIAALFMLFPTGQLSSPRWRAAVWLAVILAVVNVVTTGLQAGPFLYYATVENPFGIAGFPGAELRTPFYYAFGVPLGLALLAPAVRWRRGSPVERAQIKWIGLSALVTVAAMTFYAMAFGPGIYADVGDLAVAAGLTTFPVAIGIAVLRYRLFEIDRLISRSIGWAIVTGTLVAVFTAGMLALQAALAGLTQGETIAVAASTLLAFALFQPLRRRVQASVDRRFDRRHADAERVTSRFVGLARDEVDLARVLHSFVATADDAVRPDRLAVWLRARPEGGR